MMKGASSVLDVAEGATKIFVPFFYGGNTLHWLLQPKQEAALMMLLPMWVLSVVGVCAVVWKLFGWLRRRVDGGEGAEGKSA
jgi:hypothetical protein